MKIIYSTLRLLLYTFVLFGITNFSYSKTTNFNYDANNISNYFSGLVSFNNFDYINSEKFFKKINSLEETNDNYSSKLIQSLINQEKYKEAQIYAKKIEKKNLSNFESNLVLGLMEFKNKNYLKSEAYFNKLQPNIQNSLIYDILKTSLNNWLVIEKTKDLKNIQLIESLSNSNSNLKAIQKTFANCYFDTESTTIEFQKIINNNDYDFSRYHFFFANYLSKKNNITFAEKVIKEASEKYPGNLLINQLNKTFKEKEKNRNQFNCKKSEHIIAEIFYIIGNALSSTGDYKLSNFYVNLSKYLNPNFISFESLLGENFLILKKYDKAVKVYKKLGNGGSIYKWYSNKQIANILNEENKKEESVSFLTKEYNKIDANIYQTFEFANFLKNNKEYKKSIILYSNLLSAINENHNLYPKVLDRRGIAYERSDEWELAEKDLLLSLKLSPDEPYVMNYLAYSWIEKEKNINKAIKMLRKANKLKKNDGYITDSLGWALYKLKNYLQAKEYLRLAITLMPTDPVVNDHFADCLWMNGQKIQARYYWEYVLNLKSTEKDLKDKVKKKLLFGLEKI